MSSLASGLDTAADLASTLANKRGPVGVAAAVSAVALRAASAIAQRGKDPVAEITRILAAEPDVTAVHGDWDAMIDRMFETNDTEPPSAGVGLGSMYEDTDGKEEEPPS